MPNGRFLLVVLALFLQMPIQFDLLNNPIQEPELQLITVKNGKVLMNDSVAICFFRPQSKLVK
ncbi:MAG TPA: hypothetical protein PK528_10025, partial [Syntrophorhabdus sp.]|nr:hypothetical protein [Syntrophorhabdus sp.]